MGDQCRPSSEDAQRKQVNDLQCPGQKADELALYGRAIIVGLIGFIGLPFAGPHILDYVEKSDLSIQRLRDALPPLFDQKKPLDKQPLAIKKFENRRQKIFHELDDRCNAAFVDENAPEISSILDFAESFLNAFKTEEDHRPKVKEISGKLKDIVDERQDALRRLALLAGFRDAYRATTSEDERKMLLWMIQIVCAEPDEED